MALITKTDITEYLHLEGTDDDELIGDLIDRISDEIESECDRVFLAPAADVTEYYDGDGKSGVLLVKRFPIAATGITSLHDDTERTYGSDTEITSDDYIIYGDEGMVKFESGCFSKGRSNIKIVYKGGYAAADMPNDLKQAAVLLVCAEYLEGQGGIETLRDQESANRIDRMRKRANKIIEKYRRLPG